MRGRPMTGAPAQVAHAGALAALDAAYELLLGIGRRALTERQAQITDPPAETSDTADHRRPLGAGAQLQTHEDRTTRPRNLGAALEEDDRRERVASTDI
jgi:hypothetical protein